MASKSTEYELAIQIAGSIASSFNSAVGAAQGRLSALGSAVSKTMKVAAAASAAAATAVAGFAAGSMKTGMEFDSAMSQVAATMGTTTDNIQELRDFAQQMGAATAFSATEAAEALNYMALAGYSAEDSVEMLPKVLSLAAAGNIDLASASDMVTDAQSALNLTSAETAMMVDQMAKASSKTNTSVAQLGEALLTIGATGKSASGGTAELNQVLGILADNGIKGAEGGTHLRNVMLALQAPTDKAAAALQKLGVQAFDSQGNFRDMQSIFAELQASMADMTEEQRSNILNTIFNKADLASVNALLGTNAERWDEVASALTGCEGAADAMAATQLDNLAGDITLFKSALEGAQIAISDQLTPSLREFVQFGSKSLGTLTAAFQEGGLDGAMEALGGILSDGLNLIIKQAPDFVEAGLQLLGALGQGILDNLPAITSAALTIAKMLIQGLISALPMLAEGGVRAIALLAEGIASALPELIPAIVSVIFEIVKALTNPETLTSLLSAGLSILLALADGLIKAIPSLIESLPVIIENLITALISAAPMIAEAGVQLLGALVMNLPDILMAILRAIPAIISGILNAFGQSELAEGLSFIFQNAFSGIFTALDHIKAIFSSVIDFINNVFAGNWSDAWQNIQDIFANLFSAIVDLAKMPINGVISAINFVLEKINGLSIDIPDWVPVMGGKTFGGFNIPTIPQLAEGGVVTAPTLLEAGEAGDEAIIPLPKLWSRMQSLLAEPLSGYENQLAELTEQFKAANTSVMVMPFSNLLSDLVGEEAESGTDSASSPPIIIYYQPNLYFDGGTPSKEDIVEAGRISQEEFNRMATRWQKDIARLSLKE